jgi:methylmalonyl-CoA mutase C-terminal domain/subunit
VQNETSKTSNRIGCVLGMLGSDVHTKGIRTVSRLLSDAGIEVTFAGEHLTNAQMIAAIRTARPEFVGLSFSTAGYLDTVRAFVQDLATAGLADDVAVMIGGLVHPDDEAELAGMGVTGLFGPGTTTADIIGWMNSVSAQRTFGPSEANLD